MSKMITNVDNEAVSILDYPHALLKWSVAGPVITSMLEEIEDMLLIEIFDYYII